MPTRRILTSREHVSERSGTSSSLGCHGTIAGVAFLAQRHAIQWGQGCVVSSSISSTRGVGQPPKNSAEILCLVRKNRPSGFSTMEKPDGLFFPLTREGLNCE